MKFNEYQDKALQFDLFGPERNVNGVGFMEKVLGLVGEAGETADKFKKIIRDRGGAISDDDRLEITKELGDVMWYVAAIAAYLDVSLDDVAQINIKKLSDRAERGQLSGEGDER